MHTTTPIAENHIRISRTLFNEGMRATESKAYRKTIRNLIMILLALYLAVALWLWYTGGSLIFLFGESIFLGALIFWLVVMLPSTKRRSKYKAMTNEGDSIPERTVRFYQDYLSVIGNSGKETIIQYNSVNDWLETKHLYILNSNYNTYILLDKKGFVIGDFPIIESVLKDNIF